MTLHVYHELEQGTPEWLQARCGILTASTIGRLLTPGLKVADNDASRKLTLALAAERITGRVDQTPMTPAMWRGVMEEPLARDLYAATYRARVEQVGFMVRDLDGCQIGYSPDGLAGDDGLIEIKSRSQTAQIATVIDGQVPAANMAQLQAGLLVSGRHWIDYCSYSNGMAMWVTRVFPRADWQHALIQAATTFEDAVAAIIDDYQQLTRNLPVADYIPDQTEITFGD